MKKIITIFFVLFYLFLLSACGETDEQNAKRLQENAQRANEAAQKAVDNYNDLVNDLNNYQKAQDYLDSFK